MRPDCFAHLSDGALLHDYAAHRARRHRETALELAYLGEIEARRLYRPAAYPDMHAYCVGELHFSEDSAYKHVRAARLARRHPLILDAVAEGRLHLSAIVLLKPHVTIENVGDLIAAATHRSKRAIERMLAARFPPADLPERIELVSSLPPAMEDVHESLAPGPIATPTSDPEPSLAPERVEVPASPTSAPTIPAVAEPPAPRPGAPIPYPRVKPLSAQRYGYQFTGDQRFHDDLERFRALLAHRDGATDVVTALHQALRLGIRELEKRKRAATDRPRAATKRPSSNPRHVPAAVERAVWKRDSGQCTFVSESGRRCEARDRLELDHELPIARGGSSTVGNLRLRCRAHNQLEAERTYGAEFMRHKLEAARETRARRGTPIAERARAAAPARCPTPPRSRPTTPPGP